MDALDYQEQVTGSAHANAGYGDDLTDYEDSLANWRHVNPDRNQLAD
jgi:hypothetical protein